MRLEDLKISIRNMNDEELLDLLQSIRSSRSRRKIKAGKGDKVKADSLIKQLDRIDNATKRKLAKMILGGKK